MELDSFGPHCCGWTGRESEEPAVSGLPWVQAYGALDWLLYTGQAITNWLLPPLLLDKTQSSVVSFA